MPDFSQILLLAGIVVPLVLMVPALRGWRPRMCAIAGSAFTLVCVSAAGWPVLSSASSPVVPFGLTEGWPLVSDAFSAVPTIVFAAMMLGVAVASPRRDHGPRGYAGLLLLLASTIAADAAISPAALFVAWTASAAPFILRMWPENGSQRTDVRGRFPVAALIASSILLAGGLWVRQLVPGTQVTAFALLMLAALVRKGVFPFHTWVISAFSDGPLLPFGLLINAHFGALLVARVAIPLFPELAREALPLVSNLAMIGALYTAFAGLGEANPRRLLALTMLSQTAFIFGGLESRTVEGIAGALTHLLVVSAATGGLLLIYRLLEARGVTGDGTTFSGLAGRAPRFAVYFAICGLALVGLPGTLGFAAEDLLFHGALESHPLLGMALPLATALNAINIYRLFSRLFLGRRAEQTPPFRDALPWERAVLTAVVLFLIAGGLAPHGIITLRTETASMLATVLTKGVSHVNH